MVSSVSLFCRTLPVRHSREGGNLTESAVEYPVGTASSVPGTGDSRLRGSDVKVFEGLPVLVRHILPVRHCRAGGNLTESTSKYPVGTAAFLPGTGDSRLRGSDVKVWENIEDKKLKND